jgi:hypothetical protein
VQSQHWAADVQPSRDVQQPPHVVAMAAPPGVVQPQAPATCLVVTLRWLMTFVLRSRRSGIPEALPTTPRGAINNKRSLQQKSPRFQGIGAPRGASSYPRRSREELGGRFLGPMAYLEPKGEGNNSMPGKQRSCPGVRSEVLRDPRDMGKATLPESQSPDDATRTSAGKTPETGAMPCVDMAIRST